MVNYASKLAKIITEHSLDVKKDDKVLIDVSNFISNELTFEVYKQCLSKGAIVHIDVMGMTYDGMRSDTGGYMQYFLNNANQDQLKAVPEIMKFKIDWADKFVRIVSVEDPTFLKNVNQENVMTWQNTYYPHMHKLIDKPWVLIYYPTKGTAKLANMSLKEFTDFFYKSTVIDYKKQSDELLKLQNLLDKAKIIEIKGQGIDIKLNISGRLAAGADTGKHNLPDGECFIAPLESETEGYITFDLPQIYQGKEVTNIHLEFKKGKVVNYSAKKNFDLLDSIFKANKGNKIIGELGIGFNKAITKYMKQIIYDEKIYGTVHFALGSSYKNERGGGKNEGTVHWDMIKDLRHKGSYIKLDGKIIQKNGKFIF